MSRNLVDMSLQHMISIETCYKLQDLVDKFPLDMRLLQMKLQDSKTLQISI